VPLVGCNSHRLNLARQDYYRDPVRAAIIEKVDNFMKSVRTLKNSSKLRKQTQLQPERRNVTRWTSTNRVRLLPFIGQCGFSEDVLQYVPNAVECGLLDSILKDDEPFQSATNALQRSGSTMLELNEVRSLFDTLIAKVPSVESRLKADADIVQWPDFETAVIKVQSLNEESLTRAERDAI
ncbi:unnamed protein product, partial [Ectocarpus fasciculatus]